MAVKIFTYGSGAPRLARLRAIFANLAARGMLVGKAGARYAPTAVKIGAVGALAVAATSERLRAKNPTVHEAAKWGLLGAGLAAGVRPAYARSVVLQRTAKSLIRQRGRALRFAQETERHLGPMAHSGSAQSVGYRKEIDAAKSAYQEAIKKADIGNLTATGARKFSGLVSGAAVATPVIGGVQTIRHHRERKKLYKALQGSVYHTPVYTVSYTGGRRVITPRGTNG